MKLIFNVLRKIHTNQFTLKTSIKPIKKGQPINYQL